jgi:hypothetical protein
MKKTMRIFFWVLLVVALSSLAVWIVFSSWFPKTPLTTALVHGDMGRLQGSRVRCG